VKGWLVVVGRVAKFDPPVVSSSRASKADGGSTRTRAAASSMASGRPSSRRQISPNGHGILAGQLESRSGCVRPLHEQSHRGKARQIGEPRYAGGASRRRRQRRDGELVLSAEPSTVRLVTRTTRPAAALRSSATSGAAGVSCSKLSSSSTSRRGRKYALTSAISGPPEVLSPSPVAMAAATKSATWPGEVHEAHAMGEPGA
jgi:hypothetical protein